MKRQIKSENREGVLFRTASASYSTSNYTFIGVALQLANGLQHVVATDQYFNTPQTFVNTAALKAKKLLKKQ